MRILVVDDDCQVLEALTVGLALEWKQAEVLSARDGEAALRAFVEHGPDIVVLDVVMPGRDGFAVLQEIRRVSDVPVILLTAKGEEIDQVRGLELGADDYIVKPFHHATLVARIRAVMRRAELMPPEQVRPDFVAGDLAVYFQDHRVTLGGEPVKLTPVEFKLLYQLVRNADQIMPHQLLLDRVWGEHHPNAHGHLKVFISRLRAKIESPGGPHLIQNEFGLGYRFARPVAMSFR